MTLFGSNIKGNNSTEEIGDNHFKKHKYEKTQLHTR